MLHISARMDWSIILGVIGVVVSIGVGLGTFFLAQRSARRGKWETAKNIILRDLSKSLGDGTVPTSHVILAIIRSVLRDQNVSDTGAVTIDEIKDDLLRQITSDPFLEAGRRKQLQDQVDALQLDEHSLTRDERSLEGIAGRRDWSTIRSIGFSLLGAVLTAFILARLSSLTVPGFKDILAKAHLDVWIVVGLGLFLIALQVMTTYKPGRKQ
ncbi:MAG TPA: hypothetical protein VGZ48_05125 [Candidatus Acidoferrales bacterium]|jgi:hypothetical protein|nr:hypothetical protein [Candidatus Acidoferrales bacterium]